MARSLDHVAHAVRDLDAAADAYRRLGFTVGARNRHPWGTHNHIIQTPGFFVELVSLAEPDKLGDDTISRLFGAYNGEFSRRHDGLSMLILESSDAERDEQDFRAAGIAAADVQKFEREARRPDGSAVKVGFSLSFAEDRHAPDIHFCTCRQHYPENFWNPAFQTHPNGVRAINGVVAVAQAPAQHLAFMEAFAGLPAIYADDDGFSLITPRGAIEVLKPAIFHDRYGVAGPDTGGGARLAALRFLVDDAQRMQDTAAQAGIGGLEAGTATVIGPQQALGAVLVFETGA